MKGVRAMARDGFIIHEEHMDDVLELTHEEQGELLTSLVYHYRGEEYEPQDKAVKMLSHGMCRRMDYDAERYRKKAEAGAKGGRTSKREAEISKDKQNESKNKQKVSKEKQSESKNKQSESKSKLTVTVTDTVTDTVTVKDNNPPFPPLGGNYSEDPELDDAVRRYIAHRKKIKKPITDEGSVRRLLKKLDGMASTTSEKVAILNQSIDNCWQGLFPLKDKPKGTDDFLLKIARGEG